MIQQENICEKSSAIMKLQSHYFLDPSMQPTTNKLFIHLHLIYYLIVYVSAWIYTGSFYLLYASVNI